jgi:hypothetical protein
VQGPEFNAQCYQKRKEKNKVTDFKGIRGSLEKCLTLGLGRMSLEHVMIPEIKKYLKGS